MTRAPNQSRWKYGAHRIGRCHVPRAVHVWSSGGVLGLFDLQRTIVAESSNLTRSRLFVKLSSFKISEIKFRYPLMESFKL